MTSWKEMEKVTIPKGIKASQNGFEVTIGGPKGELKKAFTNNYVTVMLKDGEAAISVSKENQYSKAIVGTWKSLIQSMIHGVQAGYQYEMKIDYTHFPMRVSVRGDKVVIENFLGERAARSAKIIGHCSVSVKGDRVFVSGIDKYEVGETAANIERATKIKGFDLRVFQDGIYLIGGN
jgi:large subunit ribosomal protein L6